MIERAAVKVACVQLSIITRYVVVRRKQVYSEVLKGLVNIVHEIVSSPTGLTMMIFCESKKKLRLEYIYLVTRG